MSFIRREPVTIVSSALGAGTGYSPVITGKISQIRYVKSDYADGVDFTITAEATGETIWSEQNVNASATRAPRQPTHGTDGAAALYAGSGTAVQAPIALANDRVKIVIANAGDTKTGTFHIVIE